MQLVRQRAEAIAHVQNTVSQYNLPPLAKKLSFAANREGVAEQFPEETCRGRLGRADWTGRLDAAPQTRLGEFTGRFLADKAISAAGGMKLTPDQRVLIAMLCCRPVLQLDYGWLDGWHEVIVYPDRFRTPEGEDDRPGAAKRRYALGESWWRGPLILSWADVCADVDRPKPGRDVVVHEIAHKLDGLHDGVDGAPRLHMDERRGWARDFQAAYDSLCAELDAGRKSPIDPYAAKSHAEFFAVCSEYWFTPPAMLHAAQPAVAGRLEAFHGGAPPVGWWSTCRPSATWRRCWGTCASSSAPRRPAACMRRVTSGAYSGRSPGAVRSARPRTCRGRRSRAGNP